MKSGENPSEGFCLRPRALPAVGSESPRDAVEVLVNNDMQLVHHPPKGDPKRGIGKHMLLSNDLNLNS